MNEFIESLIDWDKFDATSDVDKRVNNITEENLKLEVELWEKQLKMLAPLDYQKIKSEISGWDISIPSSLDFDSIAGTYARLVMYKNRISTLWADAKMWRETCEEAIDYLEDLSPGAFPGTGADKKSRATYVVKPFVHLKSQTQRLENYLEKMHGCVMFCATQLDLLIKEKQSKAKLNHRLAHEGEAHMS